MYQLLDENINHTYSKKFKSKSRGQLEVSELCKAQFSCPKALKAALELLGLRVGPKDKATESDLIPHFSDFCYLGT